jgi:hypothetical protein
MTTRSVCSAFGALLVVVLLGGCDDSENPLSKPSESKPDDQLIGTWREVREKGGAFYHVGRLGGKSPESVMRMIIVNRPGEAGEIRPPSQGAVFPTTINGNNYLNIFGVSPEMAEAIRGDGWKDGAVTSYFLMKYEVQPDGKSLLLWPMSDSAKREFIKDGRIKGQIKQAGHNSSTRLTDTTENVARLVAAEADKLYSGKPIEFRRVD